MAYERVHVKEPWRVMLTDGSIVHEPPYEDTPAGRNVRLVGSENYTNRRNLFQIQFNEVERRARWKELAPWVFLGREGDEKYVEHFDDEVNDHAPAKLHYMEDARQTKLYWRFESPTFRPLVAQIIATIGGGYGGSRHELSVVYQVPNQYHEDASLYKVREGSRKLTGVGGVTGFNSSERRIPEWLAPIPLGTTEHPTPRAAVKELYLLAQHMNGLEQVQIPDARPGSTTQWLPMNFARTNATEAFNQVMLDYLNAETDVDRLVECWDEIRSILRRVGLKLDKKDVSHFDKVLGGQLEYLQANLDPVAAPDGRDENHEVVMDLLHGAVVVKCKVEARQGPPSTEEVEAWEIERLKLEFQGIDPDEVQHHIEEKRIKAGDEKVRQTLERAQAELENG